MIEEVFEYVKRRGDYRKYISEEGFGESWVAVTNIIEENKAKKNRLMVSTETVLRLWPEDRVREWMQATKPSGNLLEMVRRAAKNLDFDSVSRRVNRAVIERLALPRRGVSTKKETTTSDWARAVRMTEEPRMITTEELRKHGLKVGMWGLVEEGETLEGLEFGSKRSGNLTLPDEEIGSSGKHKNMGRDVAGRLLEELKKTTYGEESDFDEGYQSDGEPSAKRRRIEEGGCGCSGDVTKAWKKIVASKKVLGLAADLKLLGFWSEFNHVCFPHTKAMGGHIGLMLQYLKWDQLEGRLRRIHEERLNIGKLKTDPATYHWFRRLNRPARPEDALGPYKFKHAPAIPFTYDQRALLECFGGDVLAQWERDGTVNVDVFGWWFNGLSGRFVLAEFDMYRHHLRRINGKANLGWLRNMFYSIGQQLMRQDPVYYMLYTALRPDQQWRFVSYPYYAKYAVKGDSTQFRHIDLNVRQLISSNRGGAMIQGSVSLDDEDELNCTMVLPGMQWKLGEWWQRVCERGQQADGFVYRLTPQVFTREDATALGTDWKGVPCRRGEVRVTLPQIPHGAGPSTGTRRTMLPWFVGVQDDLESLEVVEGGTWSDLSKAHRDLTSPTATPSGHPNHYGAIPYRFSAAVELTGIGALSDALVCRRRWDSPQVLHERDVVLGGDRSAVKEFVLAWRNRAEKLAVEAFKTVEAAERAAFGAKSYFNRIETPEDECGSDSDPESGTDGDSEHRGEEELTFTEEGESLSGVQHSLFDLGDVRILRSPGKEE